MNTNRWWQRSRKKHEFCLYFVLDLDHDIHSTAAILAYADSCEEDYPILALDSEI